MFPALFLALASCKLFAPSEQAGRTPKKQGVCFFKKVKETPFTLQKAHLLTVSRQITVC